MFRRKQPRSGDESEGAAGGGGEARRSRVGGLMASFKLKRKKRDRDQPPVGQIANPTEQVETSSPRSRSTNSPRSSDGSAREEEPGVLEKKSSKRRSFRKALTSSFRFGKKKGAKGDKGTRTDSNQGEENERTSLEGARNNEPYKNNDDADNLEDKESEEDDDYDDDAETDDDDDDDDPSSLSSDDELDKNSMSLDFEDANAVINAASDNDYDQNDPFVSSGEDSDGANSDSEQEDLMDSEEEAEYVQEVTTCLTAFYIQNAPDKVDDVPNILADYFNREEELFEELKKKYNKPIPSFKEASAIIKARNLPPVLPFGVLSSVALRYRPNPTLGLQYHDVSDGVLMELDKDALHSMHVEKAAISLLQSHGRYLFGIRQNQLESLLALLHANLDHPEGGTDKILVPPPPISTTAEQKTIDELSPPSSSTSSIKLERTKSGSVESAVARLEEQERERLQVSPGAADELELLYGDRHFDSSGDEGGDEQVTELKTPSQPGDKGTVEESKSQHENPRSRAYRTRVKGETKKAWRKRLRLLDQAVFEIIDTERAYFNDLETIREAVVSPLLQKLKKRSIRLSSKDRDCFERVLSIWPKLAKFHDRMSRSMWRRCVDEDKTYALDAPLKSGWMAEEDDPLCACVDEVIALESVAHLYDDFCLQYGPALSCYASELNSNKALSAHVLGESQGVMRGDSFESFLIKPVQRICKYPLLLRAVLSHLSLPAGAGDQDPAMEEMGRARGMVEAACARLEVIVEQINSHKVKHESQSKMAQVSGRLRVGKDEMPISLSEPHRLLLKVGALDAFGWDPSLNDKVLESRCAILYNDVLLLTTVRKSTLLQTSSKVYDVADVLLLKNAKLIDAHVAGCDRLMGKRHGMRLSSPDWPNCTEFVLGLDDASEHGDWLEKLGSALSFNAQVINRERESLLLQNLLHLAAVAQNSPRSATKKSMFDSFSQNNSAVLIQKTYRGVMGRRKTQVAKDQLRKEIEAALMIQRGFRRFQKKIYWQKQRRLEMTRRKRKELEHVLDSSSGDSEEDQDDQGELSSNPPPPLENDIEYEDYDDFEEESTDFGEEQV